jgi:alpha-L-fucosidase
VFLYAYILFIIDASGYIEQMFYTFNRYTMKKTENGGTTVYAFLLSWPEDPVLKLGAPIPSPNTEVTMLGYPDKFDYITGPGGQGVYVTIPKISWNKLPCQWVWVLKMTSIEN